MLTCSVFCGVWVGSAFAEERDPQQIQPQAWIREQGETKPIFDFFQTETSDGKTMLRETRFVDRSTGEDAYREKILTDSTGLNLIRYDVEQLQLDEKGTVEVDREKNRVFYKYYKHKKWRDMVEGLDEPFLVGGMLPDFLKANRKHVDQEKQLKFSLAVPYMTKSFDFSMIQEKENSKIDGIEFQNFKMSPSNFLVSAVVKPLHFFIPIGKEDVDRILGKVFLKKRTKNGWDAFQAETRFLLKTPEALASQN